MLSSACTVRRVVVRCSKLFSLLVSLVFVCLLQPFERQKYIRRRYRHKTLRVGNSGDPVVEESTIHYVHREHGHGCGEKGDPFTWVQDRSSVGGHRTHRLGGDRSVEYNGNSAGPKQRLVPFSP
jgi:hypothetical protein